MKRLALFCCSLLLFSASCISPHKGTWSDGKDWIPADFDFQKDILVVEVFPLGRRSNEHMVKWLATKYTGKYVVVDKQSIMSKTGQYGDTRKYRFAMLWEEMHTDRHGATGYTDLDWNGRFYDRQNDKIYPVSRQAERRNNFGNISYMSFLNTVMKNGTPVTR